MRAKIPYILNTDEINMSDLDYKLVPYHLRTRDCYIVTSTLVFPGTQTGADNSLRIHVSISLTSCMTTLETPSCGRPVITLHTVSLQQQIIASEKNIFHMLNYFKCLHGFIVCSSNNSQYLISSLL